MFVAGEEGAVSVGCEEFPGVLFVVHAISDNDKHNVSRMAILLFIFFVSFILIVVCDTRTTWVMRFFK